MYCLQNGETQLHTKIMIPHHLKLAWNCNMKHEIAHNVIIRSLSDTIMCEVYEEMIMQQIISELGLSQPTCKNKIQTNSFYIFPYHETILSYHIPTLWLVLRLLIHLLFVLLKQGTANVLISQDQLQLVQPRLVT